jgi:hypothetical protein
MRCRKQASTPEHLLLGKLFNEEANEPVFELTAAAERAMQ